MNYIKSILQICFQNFRKWKTDYRIWLIAIIVLLMTHSYIQDVSKIADLLETSQTAWNFPFLYAQFYMKLLFTLPLLFLFCDAPFMDANQLFVIVRAGRTKWCIGQMLYILLASAVYYLYVMALTILLPLQRIEWSTDWGALLNTIARTDIAADQGARFLFVSSDVLTYFTPIQAMWFTFLVSWLGGAFLGMIVYCCNVWLKSSMAGSIVGAVMILLSAFLANDYWTGTKWFSPFSWNTLNMIDIAGLTRNPPFWYVMTFYIGGSLLLFDCILILNRTMRMEQNGGNR